MPRLRHFAICVTDLDKSAAFYGRCFGLTRHGREDLPIGSAVYLADGVINLALLNFTGSKGHDFGDNPMGQIGANHFGFQVEDMKATQAQIEKHGGRFFFDLGDERKGNFERKFKDPDGVIFDISHNGWAGTDGRKIPAHYEGKESATAHPTGDGPPARIRHFALLARDIEKSAKFYQDVFGLTFQGYDNQPMGNAIYLSDGTVNLAFIRPNKPESEIAFGTNHWGFQVADLKDSEKKIENAGGSFFFDFGDAKHGNFEKKFKDHDGVVFDISKNGWVGTDGFTGQSHAQPAMEPAK